MLSLNVVSLGLERARRETLPLEWREKTGVTGLRGPSLILEPVGGGQLIKTVYKASTANRIGRNPEDFKTKKNHQGNFNKTEVLELLLKYQVTVGHHSC